MSTKALVKLDIIFFVKIFFISKPNSFVGIDLFPLQLGFFYLFLFSLLLFRNFDIFIRLFLFFNWSINFSFNFLLQVNGEVNELRIFSDKVFNFVLIEEFLRVFFQVNSNFCSSSDWFSLVLLDSIRSSSFRNPLVLDISVAFSDDFNLVACQEGGVEPNTELADEIDIATSEGLQETGGS